MNIYKKCTAKPSSFLVLDATLASDALCFRKNLLQKIQKLIITTDKISDKKLQYDMNTEAAKISTLSSGKIHKYEYLAGEEILTSNQRQVIEQAKLTYSPSGKAFEKQTKMNDEQGEKQIKTTEDQGEKQIKALESKNIFQTQIINQSLLCFQKII